MGRQINFYMDKKTEEEFIAYLEESFLLVDSNNKMYKNEERTYLYYCYKEDYGELVFRNDNGKIDSYKSPVIEFIRTRLLEEKKQIGRGRIWIGYEGEYDKKLLLKDYQKIVRWIKKNVPNQEYKNIDMVRRAYISNDLLNLGEEGYHFTA